MNEPSKQSFEEVRVRSAEEMLEKLSPRDALWSIDRDAWVYRGHANAEWGKAKASRAPEEFEKYPGPGWNERRESMQDMLE